MLTDKQCKNATCPPDKTRARFTGGAGLYLEVSPAGSQRWFWKTYQDGKEGRLADCEQRRDAAFCIAAARLFGSRFDT